MAIGEVNGVLKTIGRIMDGGQKLFENIRKPSVTMPIGLIWKSYPYMTDTLKKNIGNGENKYDGYGVPIGSEVNINHENENGDAMFNIVPGRNDYENYIEYVNNINPMKVSTSIGSNNAMFNLYNSMVDETDWESYIKYDPTFLVGEYQESDLSRKEANTALKMIGNAALGKTIAIARKLVDGDDRVGLLTGGALGNSQFNTGGITLTDNGKNPHYEKTNNKDADISFYGYKRRFYTPDNPYVDASKTLKSAGDLFNNFQYKRVYDSYPEIIDGYGLNMTYAEVENGYYASDDDVFKSGNAGDGMAMFNRYKAFQITGDTEGHDDLIMKTNKLFHTNLGGNTIIARFHTDTKSTGKGNVGYDPTATAVSNYGFSHGRNLLKLNPTRDNGYDNPYCRVWTYHYQYHRLADCIRPFISEDNTGKPKLLNQDEESWKSFRSINEGGFDNGGVRLFEFGAKNRFNGLVNYAPTLGTADNKYSKVDVKKCMFSIENLAWKGIGKNSGYDRNGLSEEQRGPFGGRIMWFPPYGLTFTESVNTTWESTEFIGRGEPVYTYKNTTRTGTIDFKILIDHPDILNEWERARKSDEGRSEVDDVTSNEQTILRFFAGCENLEVGTPDETNPDRDKKKNVEPVNEKPNKNNQLVYFLFYPNNYTGMDDGPVRAWEYLLNGIGYGDVRVANEENDIDIIMSDKVDDWNPDKELYLDGSTRIGGYEVFHQPGITADKIDGMGISLDANIDSPQAYPKIGILERDGDIPMIEEYLVLGHIKKPCEYGTYANEYYWRYRVDENIEYDQKGRKREGYDHEVLRKKNYQDTATYGLNSYGYYKLLKIFKDVDKDNLYSAAEIFKALYGDAEAKNLDSTMYDTDRVATLKKIFEERKIKSVEAFGWASKHGYDLPNNVNLGEHRAKTAMGILNKIPGITDKMTIKGQNIEPKQKIDDVSGFSPKAYRSAKVVITFEDEEVNDQRDTAREAQGVSNDDNGSSLSVSNVLYTPLDGKNTVNRTLVANKEPKRDWLYASPNDRNRYDEERRFFQLLPIENSFAFNKITEKVKYFNPAYHSITPEGFNARLTFLHQCTRQGPTVGASDVQNSKTANNLAFGRAPVCVLRIGDFFYTKIIIESFTIKYDEDGIKWDMNQEGIGVMPMYATVSMNIKFLGGSDLAGPINRLQNATSFNYYANTGVYDNRSDMANFDENGKITKYKAYNPQIGKVDVEKNKKE